MVIPSRPRQCGRFFFLGASCPTPAPTSAAALALANAGVKIFPAGVDKRPLFSGWQEIATTECDIIADWWRRAPHALPAIPCGVNGLLVIDLDRHGNGSDGVRAFKELIVRHGALPPGVPTVRTPNNGSISTSAAAGRASWQWPRQPSGRLRRARRRRICDRPGAVLPDGRGWVRVTDRPPVTQAAQLAWIEGILRPPAAAPPHVEPTEETSDQRGRAYAEQALQEIEAELAVTREGERNERLYKAAFRLGTMAARGWLAEAGIRNALHRACQTNGLYKEDGVPAFQRTLESGFRDGLKFRTRT